jgi:hypothetical protein
MFSLLLFPDFEALTTKLGGKIKSFCTLLPDLFYFY